MELKYDHKVLLVLDHGPKFLRDSGKVVPVNIKDSATNTLKPMANVNKTVWSVAVECAVDMHRVVSDLFPEQKKLMRFVLSDCVGRFLTPAWGESLITPVELMRSLATAGRAVQSEDANIVNGVRMAVDALSEKTELYKQLSEELANKPRRKGRKKIAIPLNAEGAPLFPELENEEGGPASERVSNEGAMVILTSVESESELTELEQSIVDIVKGRNMILKNIEDRDSSFAQIDLVKVFILNIVPVGTETKVQSTKVKEIDPVVHSRLISCEADGEKLRAAIHAVTLDLYDLISSTVSGIPMKEESLPGQSVNYDVELFHPRVAHKHLEKLGLLEPGSHLLAANGTYDTVKLSWVTPSAKNKMNLAAVQFPRISCAVRVSAASSNSRQSVCLTSFLISGRTVLLEVGREISGKNLPANVGQKLITHTMIAHAGRIYVHAVKLGPDPVLDDKAHLKQFAIPAAPGLRVNDFKKLMQQCTVAVPTTSLTAEQRKTFPPRSCPNAEALVHIKRVTRYWPLKQEDSLIYNLNERFEPLFSRIQKTELTAEEADECARFLYEIIGSKEALVKEKFPCTTVKNMSSRAEQHIVALNELACHLANYVNHSEKHLQIYQMFMKTSGLERTSSLSTQDVSLTEPVKPQVVGAKGKGVNLLVPDVTKNSSSRSGSPAPKKTKKEKYRWNEGETVKLSDFIYERQVAKLWQNWRDFVGREEAGNKPAKLYPNLDLNQAPQRGEVQ